MAEEEINYEKIEEFLRNIGNSSNCTPFPPDLFEGLTTSSNGRQIGVSAAYGIICATGLIANVVLMFLLLTGGRKGATFKAPSTILIMNLAIADMLFLLTLPFSISQRMIKGWAFGNAMCKFEEGVKFLNYYGSVFFITAMAVDRYLVISRPVLMKNRKSVRRYMWILSAILWGLALISVIPLLIFAGVDNHGFCSIMFPRGPTLVSNMNKFYKDLSEVKCMQEYMYTEDDYYEGGDSEVIKTDTAVEYSYDEPSDSMGAGDGEGSGSGEDYLYDIEDELGILVDQAGEPLCKHPHIPSMHIWLVWNFIIGFVVPFFVISICYVQLMTLRLPTLFTPRGRQPVAAEDTVNNNIVRTSSSSSWREDANKLISQPDPTTNSSKATSQRAKLLMNVLVPCLIAAFALCWLPYHLFHLLQINGIHMADEACRSTRDATFCLAFFNSALNPILNSFFLYNFKQRLQQSKMWVSSRLKILKRKNGNLENSGQGSGSKNENDGMMTVEPTVMTSATVLEDEHTI